MSTVNKNRKIVLENYESYIGLLGLLHGYDTDSANLKYYKKYDDEKEKIEGGK